MSPPIPRDWWLAAALTSATVPTVLAQSAPGDRRPSGVLTTVAVEAGRTSSSSAPLFIDSAQGQKLTTGPNTTLHVLFPDQSALTVAPNSELVITRFEFDSRTKQGNVLIDMSRGLLRVVGGLISKNNPTRVRTPTATIGIRGGISTVDVGTGTQSTFLFGDSMSVEGSNGDTTNVNRPGFGVIVGPDGIPLPPFRADVNELTRQFTQNSPGGGGGGGGTGGGGSQGQSGGTLPGGGQGGSGLAPDRLPTSRDVGGPPGTGGGGGSGGGSPPTLNDVLGAPATNQGS
jgi:hypothetical protein